MTRYRLLTGLAVSLLLLFTIIMGAKFARAEGGFVTSQLPCNETKALLKILSEQYKEEPAGVGLTEAGDMITLFVSETGTYTVLITSPRGHSCISVAGIDWSMKPVKKQGKDL